MTYEEFLFLRNFNIEPFIEKDDIRLALQGVPRAVCEQVKYLKRAKTKLPDYYNKRCIIPSLSFEQSSSRQTAGAKMHSGERCLDMTCGLGVDTVRFSGRFKEVTTIERDETLASIARHNFEKLGITNVTVENCDSLEYLKSYASEPFDLIYIDPARRSHDKKVFLFEDCSPNLFEVLEYAPQKSRRLVIKASPLFDVTEAERLFCQYGKIVIESVSLEDECKELVIDIEFSTRQSVTSRATIIDKNGTVKRYDFQPSISTNEHLSLTEAPRFLHIADVAFYKGRLLGRYLNVNYPTVPLTLNKEDGVVLSSEPLIDFAGRSYIITTVLPYKSKILKQYVTEQKIKSVSILKRGGKTAPAELHRILKTKEGGETYVIEVDNNLYFLQRHNTH